MRSVAPNSTSPRRGEGDLQAQPSAADRSPDGAQGNPGSGAPLHPGYDFVRTAATRPALPRSPRLDPSGRPAMRNHLLCTAAVAMFLAGGGVAASQNPPA